MSLRNINRDLLRERGFEVTSSIGSGYMGEVYKGVCNHKAVKLVITDVSEADSDRNILIIENQTYRTESIAGKEFALKSIVYNMDVTQSSSRSFRLSQGSSGSNRHSQTYSHVSQSVSQDWPPNYPQSHSGSERLSLSSIHSQPQSYGEISKPESRSRSSSLLSQSAVSDWEQPIGSSYSGSEHISQASIHSQPESYAGIPKPESRSRSASFESQSAVSDWGQNIGSSYSGSEHLSQTSIHSQPFAEYQYYGTSLGARSGVQTETTGIQNISTDRTTMNLPEEASIHLALNHENVVETYDVVIDHEYNRVYIITELMEMSFKRLIYDGVYEKTSDFFTLIEFLDYVKQLLNGLAYLHSKGIYHNDIHGENIMINKRDEGLVMKYVDFGLASRVDIETFTDKNYASKDLADLSKIFEMLMYRTFIDDDEDYEEDYKNVFREEIFDAMKNGKYDAVEDVLTDINFLIE